MVVVQMRVVDGDVVVELVESSQNFAGIRVTNNASISVRGKVWLDSQYFERVFTPGEVFTQNVPSKKLTDYINGNMQAVYSAGPA